MSTEVKAGTMKELEAKIGKFLLYDRILDFYIFLLLLSLVLTTLLGVLIAKLVNAEMPSSWTGILSIVGFIIPLPPFFVLLRKRAEYIVESDEWIRYYTNLVYTNLENCLKTNSSGFKKNYRKKALKGAKGFLSCVEERFNVGQFKPAKNYVGNSVTDLKKHLRYRVIPAIEHGDEGMLGNVSQIMYNFLNIPHDFSIERLNEINGQMSQRLPNEEPLHKRRISRTLAYVQTHKLAKHSIFILVFVAACSSLGYLAVTYLGIAREYVWTGTIALFVGLLIVYFQRQPKSET